MSNFGTDLLLLFFCVTDYGACFIFKSSHESTLMQAAQCVDTSRRIDTLCRVPSSEYRFFAASAEPLTRLQRASDQPWRPPPDLDRTNPITDPPAPLNRALTPEFARHVCSPAR